VNFSLTVMNEMSEDYKRYLRLLRIRQKNPSFEELARIVRAHIIRIPFENISKLYYLRTFGLKDFPQLKQYLDGIEQYNFGGTCYANNYHLHQLLRFLGYTVEICGSDMTQQDAHIVNLVKIEGREFIVDVGYAAPFLSPLPRDLSADYRLSLGTDEYVLKPVDSTGCSRLILYREGIPKHGYLMNPTPRCIKEFAQIVSSSFRPEATFMNCLMLARFRNDYSLVLHNMMMIESRGRNVQRKSLKTTKELIAMIDKKFAIPSSVSRIALEELSMSKDAWS